MNLHLSDLSGVMVPVTPGHEDRLDSYVVTRDRKAGAQEDGGEWHVLVARGQTHLCEGREPGPMVTLFRTAAAAGIREAVLVNTGSYLHGWHIDEVMTITDCLNLTGSSPFDGPAFTDVCSV